MTASVIHVTNRTHPGVSANPTRGPAPGAKHPVKNDDTDAGSAVVSCA
jgi:hypothetical protein